MSGSKLATCDDSWMSHDPDVMPGRAIAASELHARTTRLLGVTRTVMQRHGDRARALRGLHPKLERLQQSVTRAGLGTGTAGGRIFAGLDECRAGGVVNASLEKSVRRPS